MKKGDKITIVDIEGDTYKGTFLRKENAVWGRKRKAEPTIIFNTTDHLGHQAQGAIVIRNTISIKGV